VLEVWRLWCAGGVEVVKVFEVVEVVEVVEVSVVARACSRLFNGVDVVE
jgi:hypothetical protein